MADSDESKITPPYGSFGTFWNYVGGLKADTLPPQLDRSMMRGESGSDQAVINMGLKFFELVDPAQNNAVLGSLKALVAADAAQRKVILAEMVRSRYPDQIKVSEQHGTEKLLHETFDVWGMTGETRRKAATFFIHAANMAGITVSPNFPKARTGQGRPATGTAKKAAPRKKAAARVNPADHAAGGDTYSINLESGGTVQLIVNADLMALLRHESDRVLVTELIAKMEGYAGVDDPGDPIGDEDDDAPEEDDP